MTISLGLFLTLSLVIWFFLWGLKCFVTVGRTYTIIMGIFAFIIAVLYAISVVHVG